MIITAAGIFPFQLQKKEQQMRTYDAECPVCGTRNSGLFLEETEGWMECRACRSIVNVRRKAVPCPAFGPEKPAKKK